MPDVSGQRSESEKIDWIAAVQMFVAALLVFPHIHPSRVSVWSKAVSL